MQYVLAFGAAFLAWSAHDVGHTAEGGMILAAAILVLSKALSGGSPG